MGKYKSSPKLEKEVKEQIKSKAEEANKPLEIRLEEVVIPQRISVYTDKKTKAKSIALPFQLPDGSNGAVIITRLDTTEWIPSKHILKVVLHLIK